MPTDRSLRRAELQVAQAQTKAAKEQERAAKAARRELRRPLHALVRVSTIVKYLNGFWLVDVDGHAHRLEDVQVYVRRDTPGAVLPLSAPVPD